MVRRRRGPVLGFPSKFLVFIIPSTPRPKDRALPRGFRGQILGCVALSDGCLICYLSGPKVIPESTTAPFSCTGQSTLFFSLFSFTRKFLIQTTVGAHSRMATSNPATEQLVLIRTCVRDPVTTKILGEKAFSLLMKQSTLFECKSEMEVGDRGFSFGLNCFLPFCP